MKYNVSFTIDNAYEAQIRHVIQEMIRRSHVNLSNLNITETSNDFVEDLKLWVNRVSRPSERI